MWRLQTIFKVFEERLPMIAGRKDKRHGNRFCNRSPFELLEPLKTIQRYIKPHPINQLKRLIKAGKATDPNGIIIHSIKQPHLILWYSPTFPADSAAKHRLCKEPNTTICQSRPRPLLNLCHTTMAVRIKETTSGGYGRMAHHR
ncbi:hypothetical protein EVAR_87762_1 [Eumeta japonica]|uniref:Uncharacterized protein n=1 Tax=Eumeta variegata TaxID=151549 RepID=A0A4C1X7G6_EUMVA|nr:hypothetical protein EVAR_87762_1 [Eumeta japonica]